MDIKDKRIIVTGGTSGIGFALATDLARKGARVFIAGRREEVLARALERLRLDGADADGISADVTTDKGRSSIIDDGVGWLGGLDILINNAGGVRAGRLEKTPDVDIVAMVQVNLLAPIMLTRLALPHLRADGGGLVVNIASGIALIGMPFYSTYAAVKAGVAHFGEALRRELNGEGVRVMTAFPGATDTPMMTSSKAGPDLGFTKEPAKDVADAIIAGIEAGSLEVIRGGEARKKMIALNRDDPEALDQRFLGMKSDLEKAVSGHSAL